MHFANIFLSFSAHSVTKLCRKRSIYFAYTTKKIAERQPCYLLLICANYKTRKRNTIF